jgi:hypothetical protein
MLVLIPVSTDFQLNRLPAVLLCAVCLGWDLTVIITYAQVCVSIDVAKFANNYDVIWDL